MAQASTGSTCLTHVASYVYVRGLTSTEAALVAPEQIVPRLALEHQPQSKRIVVLDPYNRFKPKKNGEFPYQNVFWSASDPHPDAPVDDNVEPVSNDAVFAKVIEPCIPAIVEGYDTAFLCIGGPDTGKSSLMFGNEKGPSGLVFIFAERIVGALRAHNDDAARLTLTVEVIECTANDQYIDLLAKARPNRSGGAAPLRVREDPHEGCVLGGATRYPIEDTHTLLVTLQQALKAQKRSRHNIVVTFRIAQEYQFSTAVNIDTMKQTVHHAVVFGLIRNFGAPLVRCFDAAVERDTGENPHAKAPTRDNAFSRLCPEIFNGMYNTAVIYCVSPHYEHAKESMATLGHSTRVHSIRTAPRQRQDTTLRNLRRLNDEVKSLSKNVESENESMTIVQEELDRRQMELESAERDFAERFGALNDRRGVLEGTHRQLDALLSSIAQRRNEMAKEYAAARAERDRVKKDIDEQNERRAKAQATSESHTAALSALTAAQERLKVSLRDLQRQVDEYDATEARVLALSQGAIDDPPARIADAKAALEKAKESAANSSKACESLRATKATLAASVERGDQTYGAQKALAAEVAACRSRIEAQEAEKCRLEKEIAALREQAPAKEESNPCCVIV